MKLTDIVLFLPICIVTLIPLLLLLLLYPFVILSLLMFTRLKPSNECLQRRKEGTFTKGKLFGHRGCRIEPLPENSLAAMETAILHGGCEGIEIDIYLSKDGIPIVFHDGTLERMCNRPGHVRDFTSDEIRSISLQSALSNKVQNTIDPAQFALHFIPTLQETIDLCCKKHNKLLMIEIKGEKRKKLLAESLSCIFQETKSLYNQAYVASFDPFALHAIKKRDPKITTMLIFRANPIATYTERVQQNMSFLKKTITRLLASIVDPIYYWSCRTWIPYVLAVDLIGAHDAIVDRRDPSALVQFWNKKNIGVNVWVCNDKELRDGLLYAGASCTTDYVFRNKNLMDYMPSDAELEQEGNEAEDAILLDKEKEYTKYS